MGNFIHSDLTNTRDLIKKLNILEDSGVSTGDNLLIECHNSEDTIIFNESQESVFEDITSAYEVSKNIILKLEYNSTTTILLGISSYEGTIGGPYTFKFSSIKQNNSTENIIYIITFTKSSNVNPVYSAVLNEQSVSKVLFFDIDATDYVASVEDLDGLEDDITTLSSSSYYTPIQQASQSSTEFPVLRIQTGYGVEQFSFLRNDIDNFSTEAVLFSNVHVLNDSDYYLNVVTIYDDSTWSLKTYPMLKSGGLDVQYNDWFSGDFDWDVNKSNSTYSTIAHSGVSNTNINLIIPETESNLNVLHYLHIRNYGGSDITIEFTEINGEDITLYTEGIIGPDNYKYLIKAGSSITITCICCMDPYDSIIPVINAFSDCNLLTE